MLTLSKQNTAFFFFVEIIYTMQYWTTYMLDSTKPQNLQDCKLAKVALSLLNTRKCHHIKSKRQRHHWPFFCDMFQVRMLAIFDYEQQWYWKLLKGCALNHMTLANEQHLQDIWKKYHSYLMSKNNLLFLNILNQWCFNSIICSSGREQQWGIKLLSSFALYDGTDLHRKSGCQTGC